MIRKKSVVLLGVLILLGLVSGASSQGQPQGSQTGPAATAGGKQPPDVVKNFASSDLDVTHWKELKSKYGWKIRYPQDWEAEGIEDEAPETTEVPMIIGPTAECVANGHKCGHIEIDSMLTQPKGMPGLSPKEYLGGNGSGVFEQQALTVGGEAA